jgi:flavin-dependent dehydrogenase
VNYPKHYDIIIVGGGLAGLTAALHLSKSDLKILLLEKHSYPNHKVCGEYISNEVLDYLQYLGINPFDYKAQKISKFEISNRKGQSFTTLLPLGGFGMSRFMLDNLLYEKVKDSINVIFTQVDAIAFEDDHFVVSSQDKVNYQGTFVLGCFGKRSNIDTFLKRAFIQQSSPWLAVKAHYKYDFPEDTVALHNFDGGYCGLSKTETDVVNTCYLTTYKSFKRFGNIPEFQEKVVSENPKLKHFFKHAEPIFEKPLTISQISFDSKKPVEDHIFMLGDSAGLIHPLCGNGMAMAIHSAKLFSEVFLKASEAKNMHRTELEKTYEKKWQEAFASRLKTGRFIQRLLLHSAATNVGFSVAKLFPSIVPLLIKKTHGTSI